MGKTFLPHQDMLFLHPPTSLCSFSGHHRCESYPKLHSGCTFYFRCKTKEAGSGEQMHLLARNQGTRETENIRSDAWNLGTLPSSLLLWLCRAQVQENETVKLKVVVLIILAFIWSHAGKLALSICCTLGIRVIGQMLGIQE